VWRYPQHKSCLKDSTEEQVIGKEYDLKKVIFDEITVREYPLILGDNPAVGCGPPVTIDWKFHSEYTMEVNFYEQSRRKSRRRKRTKLSSMKRTKILLAEGHTLEEIGTAICTMNEIKEQRTDSLRASTGRNSALDFLNGAVETTGAALKATIDVLGMKAAAERSVTSMVGVGKKSSRALFAKRSMDLIRTKSKEKFLVPPAG